MRPLRCLLGSHRWGRVIADDGGRYLACRRCGKATDLMPQVPMVGPF